MSSLDQAFVKAYARRVHNRPADGQSPATGPADSASSFVDDGTLHVNHSVAESTQVWIDPIEDQQIRADVAHAGPANRMAPPTPVSPPTPISPPAAASPPARQTRSNRLSRGSTPAPQPTLATAPTAATSDTGNSSLLFEVETHPSGSPETNQHVHVAYALASLYETSTPTPNATAPHPAPATDADDSAEIKREEFSPTTKLRIDQSHASTLPAPEPAAPQLARPAASVVQAANTPEVVAQSTVAEQSAAVDEQPGVASTPTPQSIPSHAVLNPVWEVDNFDVPAAVTELFFEGPLADQISRRMADAVQSGLSSVMVTSHSEGEGRSTVAIGVAMAAARSGLRVCLIDGDLNQPTLLDDLRLDLESGWIDAIESGQPIDNVAVRSLHDSLTLIPLLAPSPHSVVTPRDIKNLLAQLRGSFDLLVIDAPASNSHSLADFAAVVETALIVRDTTNTTEQKINAFAEKLRSDGIRGVGVVENFS